MCCDMTCLKVFDMTGVLRCCDVTELRRQQIEQVIYNGNLLRGKVIHQRLLWLTLLTLALLPINLYFETGCFVYHLNELQAESCNK